MSRQDEWALGERSRPESLFLGGDAHSREVYERAIRLATDAITESFADAATPYSGASPADSRDAFDGVDLLPDAGRGLRRAVEIVRETVLEDSVGVHHPRCVAHLHCPPMIPALAAEVMLTATNQSLDSWDQSPAASVLEEAFVAELCDLFGLPDAADGVFTSGGTQSNFTGLLIARNRRLARTYGVDVQRSGLPPEAADLRILCSEAAHFTAEQAAAHLGLGEDAVVSVATDDAHRLKADALECTLDDLDDAGRDPFALVATAGTTDFGSIDPLDDLATVAADRDLWYHVDAAYGGALAVNDRHREKLRGIDRADSVAVDFHKLFYQPISCGAFLLRDGDRFGHVARNASYLNPESADEPNHVEKSVQTTRRFDALKPVLAFQAVGREGFAEIIDRTMALADRAAEQIRDHPDFDLLNDPETTALVFRYRPSRSPDERSAAAWTSAVNDAVKDRAMREGEAVVARTEVDGVTSLKLTLLNPRTTVDDVDAVLDALVRAGAGAERTLAEEGPA